MNRHIASIKAFQCSPDLKGIDNLSDESSFLIAQLCLQTIFPCCSQGSPVMMNVFQWSSNSPLGWGATAEDLMKSEAAESTSTFNYINPIAMIRDKKTNALRKIKNSDLFWKSLPRTGVKVVRFAIAPVIVFITWLEKLIHRLISLYGQGDLVGKLFLKIYTSILLPVASDIPNTNILFV